LKNQHQTFRAVGLHNLATPDRIAGRFGVREDFTRSPQTVCRKDNEEKRGKRRSRRECDHKPWPPFPVGASFVIIRQSGDRAFSSGQKKSVENALAGLLLLLRGRQRPL
jgi:hypothetical protein